MKFKITEESENFIKIEVDRSEFLGMSATEIMEKCYSSGFQVINYKRVERSNKVGWLSKQKTEHVYVVSAMKVAK